MDIRTMCGDFAKGSYRLRCEVSKDFGLVDLGKSFVIRLVRNTDGGMVEGLL